MGTCNDCYHVEICDMPTITDGRKNASNCKKFKNKADVVEVRHGEWRKPLEDNGTGWNCGGEIKQILGCSCCGHFFQNAPYNYCPNCGAKMDGGAE
jgi:rubrerythrin